MDECAQDGAGWVVNGELPAMGLKAFDVTGKLRAGNLIMSRSAQSTVGGDHRN